MPRPAYATVMVALVALLAACGAAPSTAMPEPREGHSGLQLSGTFAGKQVAVSDGLPQLLVRECSVRHGIPAEVCFASRNIDGTPVIVGLANPDVMAGAERLEAARARCTSTPGCAAVEDHALVFVRVGEDVRQATGGTVTLSRHVPGSHYVGELRLRVGGERLTGSFDVMPRPEPGSGARGSALEALPAVSPGSRKPRQRRHSASSARRLCRRRRGNRDSADPVRGRRGGCVAEVAETATAPTQRQGAGGAYGR